MEEMVERRHIKIKIINSLIVLLISFTKLGWDTKSEYLIIFQLRELISFLKKFDLYSYFYICLIILIGNFILLLNLYKINLKCNNIGILLNLVGMIWFFLLGFGSPYVNHYYLLSLFALYLIYFYLMIKKPAVLDMK